VARALPINQRLPNRTYQRPNACMRVLAGLRSPPEQPQRGHRGLPHSPARTTGPAHREPSPHARTLTPTVWPGSSHDVTKHQSQSLRGTGSWSRCCSTESASSGGRDHDHPMVPVVVRVCTNQINDGSPPCVGVCHRLTATHRISSFKIPLSRSQPRPPPPPNSKPPASERAGKPRGSLNGAVPRPRAHGHGERNRLRAACTSCRECQSLSSRHPAWATAPTWGPPAMTR